MGGGVEGQGSTPKTPQARETRGKSSVHPLTGRGWKVRFYLQLWIRFMKYI